MRSEASFGSREVVALCFLVRVSVIACVKACDRTEVYTDINRLLDLACKEVVSAAAKEMPVGHSSDTWDLDPALGAKNAVRELEL